MRPERLKPRPLGTSGPLLSPIGFGAFKIGRNEATKYAEAYVLPSDDEADAILEGILRLGVTHIDTAPAYGVSEVRVGRVLRRHPTVTVSTKVGESFIDGRSSYDFSTAATEASVERSRERLQRAILDCVFVHSNGDDEVILREGSVTRALRALRERGVIRAIGFSGKTVAGHLLAIEEGYDALMVEYHPLDATQRPAMEVARERGIGVMVKKALASGRLAPDDALPFALHGPGVTSVVIGSLKVAHIAHCVQLAEG